MVCLISSPINYFLMSLKCHQVFGTKKTNSWFQEILTKKYRKTTSQEISFAVKKWQYFDRRPQPLIDWDIFEFSSETAERNLTKLDRKQELNVLFEVCVFGPIRK